MSRALMVRPCENCPYRIDAPRQYWSREEFRAVLDGEEGNVGVRAGEAAPVWACHKQKDLPTRERGPCAGWLLDQKKRGVPSIKLRLQLAFDPDTREAFERVSSDVAMFESTEAMCRANGVRPRRRRR